MNRTFLVVIGTIVSLFVLGIVFFIGLSCGVSLESHSATQSAAEPQSSNLVINSSDAPIKIGDQNTNFDQNTDDDQDSASTASETVINNNGSSIVMNNGPSGVIQNSTGTCINGVCYDLAGPSRTLSVTSDGVRISSGKFSLSISSGRLCINGTDYGRAPTHGRVKIMPGGRVFVNGTERGAVSL